MLRGCPIPVRAEARRLQIATITADLVGQIRIGSNYFLPLSSSVPHDLGQVLDTQTDHGAIPSLTLPARGWHSLYPPPGAMLGGGFSFSRSKGRPD